MTDEQVYRDLKQLRKYPEWITYCAHIMNVSDAHKDSSVRYSSKANANDSQRQAWIAEGLIEAIEEPDNVIKSYEFSVKGLVQRVCQLCGHFIEKVRH